MQTQWGLKKDHGRSLSPLDRFFQEQQVSRFFGWELRLRIMSVPEMGDFVRRHSLNIYLVLYFTHKYNYHKPRFVTVMSSLVYLHNEALLKNSHR